MIFILGIDALDYDLIEKWRLENLKQLEYGRINVPINIEKGVPMTPEVWATFLVGKHLPMNFITASPLANTIYRILGMFPTDYKEKSYKIIKNHGFIELIKILRNKIGLETPHRFGSLNQTTFLDTTRSKEINVPYYSFDNSTFNLLYLFSKGEISLKKAIYTIKKIHEKRTEQILNEVGKINNIEVIFAFIHTTDIFQHLLYNHNLEIKKHYIDLDNFVSLLKSKITNIFGTVTLIIVSDHGFDLNNGTHSKHAFYSSNTNLIPKPNNIIDLHKLILDIARAR